MSPFLAFRLVFVGRLGGGCCEQLSLKREGCDVEELSSKIQFIIGREATEYSEGRGLCVRRYFNDASGCVIVVKISLTNLWKRSIITTKERLQIFSLTLRPECVRLRSPESLQVTTAVVFFVGRFS